MSEEVIGLPTGQFERVIGITNVNGIPVLMEVIVIAKEDGTLVSPATEATLQTISDTLAKQKFSEVARDENSATRYYAYMDKSGAYYFKREVDDGAGVITINFAASASTFAADWTGRAALSWVQTPIY